LSKTVFISGSNRGIGKACLVLFAQRGWDIIAHSRRSTPEFEDLISEVVRKNGVGITSIYFDMRDEEEMKTSIKKTLYRPKLNIDALVNNAGVFEARLLMMMPVSVIRDVFEVNLFSHMRLTQLVLKRMPKDGESSITNVASIGGIELRAGQSAYGVSKAAMIAWTHVLKEELRGQVRVNAVAPGQIDTDMGSFEPAMQVLQSGNGRLGSPDEVAKVIYFLASDEAAYVSGEVLYVTGGGGISG
jgi:3-oxoacyl-[acyl-carrier protein] reductase